MTDRWWGSTRDPTIRRLVFEMTGGKCARCNCGLAYSVDRATKRKYAKSKYLSIANDYQVDHIYPKSHGGPDHIANYQPLCGPCNRKKSDRNATDYRSVQARLTYGSWKKQGSWLTPHSLEYIPPPPRSGNGHDSMAQPAKQRGGAGKRILLIIVALVLFNSMCSADNSVDEPAATSDTAAAERPANDEDVPVTEAAKTTEYPAEDMTLSNAVLTYTGDIFEFGYKMANFEVIDLEVGESTSVPEGSRCVALLFDLTTVTVPEDQQLGNPVFNPSFTLEVDGVGIEQEAKCLESLEATGASWIVQHATEAGITERVGSTYVIEADSEPTAIVFLDEKIEIP